jgi:hypothetical protein
MFQSMILAQAEAIEAGTSCEFEVAKSARDSLELCYKLLRTHASIVSLSCPDDTSPMSKSLDIGQQDYDLDLDLGFFYPDATFS